MFDLETAIQNWIRSFRKHQAYDEASAYEMELHLRDHIEDLVGQGMGEKEAFQKAVGEFGDVSLVAEEEFWTQRRKKTIRTMLYSTLFKNYYKTTLRSMMRNPLSSLINIVGLSAAIGICIFTYSFAQWTYRTDQFHEKKEHVFLATFFSDRDGKMQQNGRSPVPLAERLKEDFPQIEAVCRIQNRSAVVKSGDRVFHQRITFADASYLTMFTFPLEKGDARSLQGTNNVILSQKSAIKYFGDKDPIGQTLLIKFSETNTKSFQVTGVAKEFPASISFNFHFLIHFDNYQLADPDMNPADWGAFLQATFIQLRNPQEAKTIADKMGAYKDLQNKTKQDWQIDAFAFEPLSTLYKRSATIRDAFIHGSEENYMTIFFLSFVGIFMLALACFNYINIAIVSATRRLKEIGIRKTIGANKRIIVVQFLTENLIATSLALLFGLLLGALVFIPWFESLFFFDMGFSWFDGTLWIFLPVVLFVSAVASGLYPSLYISRFPVTGILKGAIKFGKKNPLTRVILGFQLVLSCLFITFAIMFTQNSNYLAARNWGYNNSQALYVEVPDLPSYRQLANVMTQEVDILSLAGSANHLGKSTTPTIVEIPSGEHEVDQIAVDANYFATLDIELLQGRGFIKGSEADKTNVLVNQKFANTILDDDALGKTFKIGEERHTIIGVVKDFHSYGFDQPIEPTFFSLANPEDFRYLTIKVENDHQDSAYQKLQKSWASLFPETPFQGGYQEDVWGMYFEEIDIHGKVWRGIAGIAILLASLGLYGLVTLNVSGRIKEFSIRKILGAQGFHIAKSIARQYVLLFTLAFLIGAPFSYWLISFAFDTVYVYHVPVGIGGVALAVAILLLILILVIAFQLLRISRDNPVEGLQVE